MKPQWMKLLLPPTPKMMVLDNSLAIAPCTKSFVNSMGLQFLMFFSKLSVINPRGLVDDVMTMECPEGLERWKNVGKKERTRARLERSLYWYLLRKKPSSKKFTWSYSGFRELMETAIRSTNQRKSMNQIYFSPPQSRPTKQ